MVGDGESPVAGKPKKFRKLNKEYAEEFKGGDRTPNLDLEGDMLDALRFSNTVDGIKVGIFRAKQVPKADGHNNFSGKSTLPDRQFIPKDNQSFRRDIKAEINRIIAENEELPVRRVEGRISNQITGDITSILVDDIIDDILKDFI